ncbi:hypothetical protein [Neisseria subflava]|uniref:hypothetical protein n=1 Tax=Neisseria subflava TaxID=28449 RepID=UPI0020B753D1|nr:hypothetical protein [Neisseria subflava]
MPIGTIYTTASANAFRAPAAVLPKTCCAPSSSPPDFVAVACDKDEELIAPSLTPEQLQRHFPEFV